MTQLLQTTSRQTWVVLGALAALAAVVALLSGLYPVDGRAAKKERSGQNPASGAEGEPAHGRSFYARPKKKCAAGASASATECASLPSEEEATEIAHIKELLDSLLHVETTGLFFHDIVEGHLDKVLEVMAFIQKNPGRGFALVEELYAKTPDPLHKGLLVFMASAARDIEEARAFFRAVMADLNIPSSVRLACAYALGMANLPIEDFKTPARIVWEMPPDSPLYVPEAKYDNATLVRSHYATVLWAMGNILSTPHPAMVYIGSASYRRPWPENMVYGWQGCETRRAVLQMLIDALATETCLRTRYILLAGIGSLEDTQLLVDTYKTVYETDTWTVPPGCSTSGGCPARNLIVAHIAREAVATHDPAWLEALRWVQPREKPWMSRNQVTYLVEAWENLGWIDRPFIEWVLTPYTRPEICQGDFPMNSSSAWNVLKHVRAFFSEEEAANLFLQVARTACANAEKQIQLGRGVAIGLQDCSAGLTTENEILTVLLGHPDYATRAKIAAEIGKRGIVELVDELAKVYCTDPKQTVCVAAYEALKVLAPDTLGTLSERRFQTREEELADLLRSGAIDLETYESLLDFYRQDRSAGNAPE